MTDITPYVEYFRKLADKYKTPLDFYVMDVNEFQGSLRASVRYPCMILNGVKGELKSQHADSVLDKTMGGFLILDHCPDMNDFDRERDILNETKQIGMDILARMHHDHVECNPDHPIVLGFNLNEVKYEMFGPVFDNDFGWNFTFAIQDELDFTFNAHNWTDSDE